MMNAGHYTAYILNNDIWYFYDDAFIYTIDKDNLKKNIGNAYILLYMKR